LPRLLFIGRAITLPEVRARLRNADPAAHVGRLAQTPADLPAALADPSGDWAYLRFVPTQAQVEAVHRAKKRVFIAGPTVAEKQPENWRAAQAAGVDGFLTDEPLEARTTMQSNR
jgi:glycerophosphoryl diester phosphodiesterase